MSRPKNAKFLKLKKGDPLGFLKIQFVVKYQKNEGPLETKKIEKVSKPKKGRGKSHSAEKLERGLFSFGMVLNFMLEA